MSKVFLILIFSVLIASNQIPAPKQINPILIQGGTIHTVSDGTIIGYDIFSFSCPRVY